MSELKSASMNLSQKEKQWLPWFGETGKLAMYRSCFVSRHGEVISSTYSEHIGRSDLHFDAVSQGTKARFLHGPYVDPLTLKIGRSSSNFHDEVTLMFYQPIEKDGIFYGAICARVPNDVLGDLIQREAGHIYPESGDNYIFMVDSNFDRTIQQGTALSLSF